MKRVGILIPIYNEEQVLDMLSERLLQVLGGIDGYAFEILLVNDGSSDASLAKMEVMRRADTRFHVLNLSRNFGKEVALAAGLDYCDADAVIIMDADLQDPPELIPTMLDYWRQGYDDVYARRRSRQGETAMKKLTSKGYYRVLQRLSQVPIQPDTGDFRLLDRRCVLALRALREQGRCSKSLFSWIGYNKKEILFDRAPRAAGGTKWRYGKLAHLAVDGITALSTTPLRWAGYASAGLFALLFVYVAILAARGMLGASVSGAALVGALVLLLFAVQMAALAILGEYVGRMFNEAKRRPLYLVESYNDQRMAGEQPPAHQDAPEAHVTPSHLERVKNNVVRRIR